MAALIPLILKGDWQLKEFEKEYATRLLMTIPGGLMSQLSVPRGELYEGFGDKFADLKGQAVLIPAVHNGDCLNKTDDIILWLDPFQSTRFENDNIVSIESRLSTLFQIKEKWTLTELEAQLTSFLEPEQNITTVLSRGARQIKEVNPFNSSKTTPFYIKKF